MEPARSTATFQTGYDLDIAAVDVQNRVASVTGRLPAAVNATGISISKANPILYSVRVSLRATGAIPMSSFRITWMFT